MAFTSIADTLVSVIHPDIPQTIEWDKLEGGDLTHANQRFFTSPNVERVYPGRSARDNITTEAHLDPVAHATFIAAGNAGAKFEGAVIKLVSVGVDGVRVGDPDEYKNCIVAKWSPRKGDLNGEDMQKIIIEWEVPAP